METFLVIALVFLLAFLIFDVITYISTKKMFRDTWTGNKLDEKFIIENIIYARSGLRGVYSSLVIVTTVLALLGIRAMNDIKNTVSQEVAEEIKKTAQLDIESLRQKYRDLTKLEEDGRLIYQRISKVADEIRKMDLQALKNRYSAAASIEADVRKSFLSTTQISKQIENMYQGIRESPQKLFVVESLYVAQPATRKMFAELHAVDGFKIPKLRKPPVIIASAYRDGIGIGLEVKRTSEYVELSPIEAAYVDLWIYVK